MTGRGSLSSGEGRKHPGGRHRHAPNTRGQDLCSSSTFEDLVHDLCTGADDRS
jgi:hypothetical protein